ncbi:unnamed protein product [Agarophyton chilense]
MSAAMRRLRHRATYIARAAATKRILPPNVALRRQLLHALFIISLALLLWNSLSNRIFGLQTDFQSDQQSPLRDVDLAISDWRAQYSQLSNFPNTSFTDDVANFHTLITTCRIPPVFVSRLGVEGRRKLLIRLSAPSETIPSFENMPKLTIVDVRNGLGNRLRALASAMEFSYLTHRVLVVVWAADAHLNASIHHLFDQSVLHNLVLIQTPISWPIDPHNVHLTSTASLIPASDTEHTYQSSVSYFNFMARDSNSKQSPLTQISDSHDKHIYVRTAYVLRSEHAPGTLINAFFQALTPAPQVRQLVDDMQRVAGGEQALHTMIGVHIRSRTLAQDNDKIDHLCEYSILGAETTNDWRLRSSPNNFIHEMKRVRRMWPQIVERSQLLSSRRRDIGRGNAKFLVNIRRAPRFFAAVDTTSALNELYQHFTRDHIITLHRNCDDRDAECVQYAFADMILLSRTGAMLASGWSSFSEAAQRLRVRPADMVPWSNEGYVIRTSGIDFGWTWREKLRTKVLRWIWGKRGDQKSLNSEKERELMCKQRRLERHWQNSAATVGIGSARQPKLP